VPTPRPARAQSPLVGRLSDARGRKPFLLLSFLCSGAQAVAMLLYLRCGVSLLWFFPAQARAPRPPAPARAAARRPRVPACRPPVAPGCARHRSSAGLPEPGSASVAAPCQGPIPHQRMQEASIFVGAPLRGARPAAGSARA